MEIKNICLSKKFFLWLKDKKVTINDYFENVFEWLLKCEKIFGFNLEGYGKMRMYTFLAERYLPFWFKRNLIEILEHFATASLPVLLFLFFQKKKIENKLVLNEKKGIDMSADLGNVM